MSQHSLAEAKNRLCDLIDRALNGEEIVITRHGRAAAALKPIAEPTRPCLRETWTGSQSVGSVEFRQQKTPARY